MVYIINIIIIIAGSVKYYHNDIQCISTSVKKINSNFNSIPSSNSDSNSDSNRETRIAFLAFHRSKLTVIVIASKPPRLEFYSECKVFAVCNHVNTQLRYTMSGPEQANFVWSGHTISFIGMCARTKSRGVWGHAPPGNFPNVYPLKK